jgi:hypothetical protein
MKRRFEYQPGLFGLASVAAGCAAKNGNVRTQGDSTSAGEHRENKSRSQKAKSFHSVKQKQNRER